ncbi:catechol O-methyltransferase A-like isoform X2 [Ambystoma mexicanum]|uniref:catechol O-methyltransferase A-like isoform X2 n=1 Tax=Ambystoma mexicanum TaxID=8296 RepID=UPI0037E989DA
MVAGKGLPFSSKSLSSPLWKRMLEQTVPTTQFQGIRTMLYLVSIVSGALVFVIMLVRHWVKTDGPWALWWHDKWYQKFLDVTTGQTRPERMLEYLQKNGTRGDAASVVETIDHFCGTVEWAMNVGDQKGKILDRVVLETNPHTVLELGTYCGYSAVRIGKLLGPGARLISLEMNPAYAKVAKQVISFAGMDRQPSTLAKQALSTSPSHRPTHMPTLQHPDKMTETPVKHRRWRLQEALIFTTLQCLQLPLQLFSRSPPAQWTPTFPQEEEEEEDDDIGWREASSGGWSRKIEVLVGSTTELIPQLKKKLDIDTFDMIFLDHWKQSYLPDTKLLEECGLLRKGTVLLADNVICPGAPEYLQYVRNSSHYESQHFPSVLEYTKAMDGMEKSVYQG